MNDEANRVCVIVGAGPGNGAALARKFAAAGYRIALIARDKDRLATLAKSIPGAVAYGGDVTSQPSMEATFAAIAENLGSVDVLIYNAGKGHFGDALTVTAADFESVWRVNTFGAFLVAGQVLPSMLARGAGTIVFIGATASRRGAAKAAAFASAKAGQRVLAESLARAYGPSGVHVALLVIDAVVDEPVMRERLPDRSDDFFCRPDDIAETALALSRQARSAWTFELEVRPYGEKW